MSKQNHPVFSKPPSYKMRGRWIRHKTTGFEGYISYVHVPRSGPKVIWLVYPATSHNRKRGLTIEAAGFAHAEDVVLLKRRPVKLPPMPVRKGEGT